MTKRKNVLLKKLFREGITEARKFLNIILNGKTWISMSFTFNIYNEYNLNYLLVIKTHGSQLQILKVVNCC